MPLANNKTEYQIPCKFCGGTLDIKHQNSNPRCNKYARGSCGCIFNAPNNQPVFDPFIPSEPPSQDHPVAPVEPVAPTTPENQSKPLPPLQTPVKPEPDGKGFGGWLDAL